MTTRLVEVAASTGWLGPTEAPTAAVVRTTRSAPGANTTAPSGRVPVRRQAGSPHRACHRRIAAAVAAVNRWSTLPGFSRKATRFRSSCLTSGPLGIPAARSRYAGTVPNSSRTGWFATAYSTPPRPTTAPGCAVAVRIPAAAWCATGYVPSKPSTPAIRTCSVTVPRVTAAVAVDTCGDEVAVRGRPSTANPTPTAASSKDRHRRRAADPAPPPYGRRRIIGVGHQFLIPQPG